MAKPRYDFLRCCVLPFPCSDVIPSRSVVAPSSYGHRQSTPFSYPYVAFVHVFPFQQTVLYSDRHEEARIIGSDNMPGASDIIDRLLKDLQNGRRQHQDGLQHPHSLSGLQSIPSVSSSYQSSMPQAFDHPHPASSRILLAQSSHHHTNPTFEDYDAPLDAFGIGKPHPLLLIELT